MYGSLNKKRPGFDWSGGWFTESAYCVVANNANPMTFAGTNTWILRSAERDTCLVIDPGPLENKHLSTIAGALDEFSLNPLAVVLTHDHLDHSEAADGLASMLGIGIYGQRIGNLKIGQLEKSGINFDAIVVPLLGHSDDSVGILCHHDRSLVTGDTIFIHSPTVICWPEGRLDDYFTTLEYLERLVCDTKEVDWFLTGHGLPIDNPLAAIEDTRRHRNQRLEKIRRVSSECGTDDLDTIMEKVYDDIDQRLNPAARKSIEAQIAYLGTKFSS